MLPRVHRLRPRHTDHGEPHLARRSVGDPAVSEPLAARPLAEPHPDRLAADHPRRVEILASHDAALAERRSGYLDPGTGLFVMSAATLAERGRCCHSGCRHCPYVVGPDEATAPGDQPPPGPGRAR